MSCRVMRVMQTSPRTSASSAVIGPAKCSTEEDAEVREMFFPTRAKSARTLSFASSSTGSTNSEVWPSYFHPNRDWTFVEFDLIEASSGQSRRDVLSVVISGIANRNPVGVTLTHKDETLQMKGSHSYGVLLRSSKTLYRIVTTDMSLRRSATP